MRTSALSLIVYVVFYLETHGQLYKYGLKPTTLPHYEMSVEKDISKQLVNLQKAVPGIILDIRYATENNFTKQKLYKTAKAYSRKPVAEALKQAQVEFSKSGVGIKIFDAYRPYSVTVRLYEIYRDTAYVASPYKGSKHNRGCAIDLTLVDLKTGQELKMPTEYDSFQKEAWPSTPVSDPVVKKNRDLLISVMSKCGFTVNTSEWWHFDFNGWRNYEILDIDFEEIQD